MQPKVSVILPFYNAARTLDEAVQSIAEQTLEAWELLLMDNNSTDGSEAKARHWAERDRRIQYFHEPQQGVVFAFNRGLAAVRGRYIARMDADDRSNPERLERQAQHLDQHPELGVVASRVRYVPHQPQTRGFRKYVEWVNGVMTPEEIRLRRFIESPIVNPSAMFRAEVAQQHGSYRWGAFPEDYELWLRWLEAGVQMEKLPQELLTWRDSTTRLTRTDSRYSTEAFYRIKSEYLARWLERNNPHHPQVAVWGAGRLTRKRVQMLEAQGVQVVAFIDVKGERPGQPPVVHFSDLPESGQWFVLSYVANRGAREEIQRYLEGRGYVEGKDFLLVA